MNVTKRLEDALRTSSSGQALRRLALELFSQGQSKAEVYAEFERFLVHLRKTCAPPEQEETMLDVMDALDGWCHADARLGSD
jgi:hypothetical protein